MYRIPRVIMPYQRLIKSPYLQQRRWNSNTTTTTPTTTPETSTSSPTDPNAAGKGFGQGLVSFWYVLCAATTVTGGQFIVSRVRGLKAVEHEADDIFSILEQQCIDEQNQLSEQERARRLVREFAKYFPEETKKK